METARVDKRWAEKGLKAYPPEAIFGTLGHYGVSVDEAGFRALAQSKYPVGIALEWMPNWTGTGQFKQFPLAAATELWRRFEGERLTPEEFHQPLAELMAALELLLKGSQDAPVGRALEAAEAAAGRAPKEGDALQPAFREETMMLFSEEGLDTLTGLPQRLAREGHADDSRAFADLVGLILPELKGVLHALISAEEGDTDTAANGLNEILHGGGSLEQRGHAFQALCSVSVGKVDVDDARKLLDEAIAEKDYHLGMAVADQMLNVLLPPNDPRIPEVRSKLEGLVEAHGHAHPHHHHH